MGGGRVGPTSSPATVLCSSWSVLNSASFRSPSPFYTPLPGEKISRSKLVGSRHRLLRFLAAFVLT